MQSFPVASSPSRELFCRGSRRLFALPSPSFRWSVRGESGALPFQNRWHHLNGADNWSLACKTIILGYVYGRLNCSVKGTKWGWASSEMSLRTHGSTDFSVGYPYGWEAKPRAVTLKQCVVPMCFLIFFSLLQLPGVCLHYSAICGVDANSFSRNHISVSLSDTCLSRKEAEIIFLVFLCLWLSRVSVLFQNAWARHV